ncbi:MAG TPA: hypothetical protein VJZ00_06560 [Thermoanaerobaculia bacterium]|nr:hypothetical protein [Thermoanaerobaculia bacterium]
MATLIIAVSVMCVALALVAWIATRAPSSKIGSLIAAIVGSCVFAGAGLALEFWVAALSPFDGPRVDLPVPLLLFPVLFGGTPAWIAVHRAHRGQRTLAVLAWSGLLGALNVANFCNPGWCGRYGLPFSYYTWSDAVIMFNGEMPNPFSARALVADGVIFVASWIALWRTAQK